MKKPNTSIRKIKVDKNREHDISIAIGLVFLIAIISLVILGAIFPTTIPYSLEILRLSSLLLLAAVIWLGIFKAMNVDKQHHSIFIC